MANNIIGIEKTLEVFNIGQFENVTLYNTKKCELQLQIAGNIDTYYCMHKYYDVTRPGEGQAGAEDDIQAMCMAGGGFVPKPYAGDDSKQTQQVSKSNMAERRKYCDFLCSNNWINWTVNTDIDANTTTVYPNWDQDLEAKCPNGMVINKINLISNGVAKPTTRSGYDWHGVSESFAFIWRSGGENTFEGYG